MFLINLLAAHVNGGLVEGIGKVQHNNNTNNPFEKGCCYRAISFLSLSISIDCKHLAMTSFRCL